MREFSGKMKSGYAGHDSMREKAERMFRGEGFGNKGSFDSLQSSSSPARTKTRLYAKGGSVKGCKSTNKIHRLSHDQTDMHMPVKKTSKNIHVSNFSKSEGKKFGSKKKKRFDDGGLVGEEENEPGSAPSASGPAFGPEPKPAMPAPSGLLGRASGAFNRAQPMASRALNFARENAPRAQEALNAYSPKLGGAFQKARDFAPKVESAYNKYAPKVQSAIGFARSNAPRVQDAISRFSPNLASKFGKARSFLGLKKGGAASTTKMVGERPSRARPNVNYEANMKGEHGKKGRGYAAGGVGKIRHEQADKNGNPIGSKRKFVR